MPPPQRFFPLSHHVPAPATDERADASNVDRFLMQNDASWTNYGAYSGADASGWATVSAEQHIDGGIYQYEPPVASSRMLSNFLDARHTCDTSNPVSAPETWHPAPASYHAFTPLSTHHHDNPLTPATPVSPALYPGWQNPTQPNLNAPIPSHAQYGEPLDYPAQMSEVFSNGDASTPSDWTEFMMDQLYGADYSTSSRTSSLFNYTNDYQSSTGCSTPQSEPAGYLDSAPYSDSAHYSDLGGDDVFSAGYLASDLRGDVTTDPDPDTDSDDDEFDPDALPIGSPLKFVSPRRPSATSDAPSNSAIAESVDLDDPPNDIDISHVKNLFTDCVWRRSNRVWLDDGVWSEYITFPGKGVRLTRDKLIRRLERVHGFPTQVPTPPESMPTAFLLTVPENERVEGQTVDNLFRSGPQQSPHSWGNGTGKATGDTDILGLFFDGRSPDEKVRVRRATPICQGLLACQSLDASLIVFEQRELDPNARRKLVLAQLRTREAQSSTRVGQVLTFLAALDRFHCRAFTPDGKRCPGKATIAILKSPRKGKTRGIVCSEHECAVGADSVPHATHFIPRRIDEDLLQKALDNERIVDGEDPNGHCSATRSFRNNRGTASKVCGMEHLRDGKPWKAAMVQVACGAYYSIYCPINVSGYESLRWTCILYPEPKKPHTHLPAPGTKCPLSVQNEYKNLVRAYAQSTGTRPTPNKIENSAIAKERFGKPPSLYHPGLINLALRRRLVDEVCKETGLRGALTEDEEIAAFAVRQQKSPTPYIHSSISLGGKSIFFGAHPRLLGRIHDTRALDFDTSFKPVKGKHQIFEINGWLASHCCTITFMRVWMEPHDRLSFKIVWVEIVRLVSSLTTRRLTFKNLHHGGRILGINSDMEAAPLLGFAEAVWETLTPERQAEVETPRQLLSYVLRVCYVHFERGVDSENLSFLSTADRTHIKSLVDCKTVAAYDEWSIKMLQIPDPQRRLSAWFRNKVMHTHLLPGLVQPLSRISVDNWHLLPPNTNYGEGQHHWNNLQTGVSMTVIESMEKYAELDATTEARLAQGEISGDLRNLHNDPIDREARSLNRNIGSVAIIHRTRALDNTSNPSTLATQRIEQAQKIVADAKAALALAKAEVNLTPSQDEQVSTVSPRPAQVPSPRLTRNRKRASPPTQSESHAGPSKRACRAKPPPAPATRMAPKRKSAKSAAKSTKRTRTLDLNWECFDVNGAPTTAEKAALADPVGLKEAWPAYAALVDELVRRTQ
ncbi:hypothetical protein GGX14DRAFT_403155 [Mycena pura]|uniref:Uncharacterized protein n=1 Tax=Mycena pura TaxID=153505 RepID=A0AAD6V0I9_9AGAR|nr:hypothetical protein GGX14DRAFT_403155 [Mycena pura]